MLSPHTRKGAKIYEHVNVKVGLQKMKRQFFCGFQSVVKSNLNWTWHVLTLFPLSSSGIHPYKNLSWPSIQCFLPQFFPLYLLFFPRFLCLSFSGAISACFFDFIVLAKFHRKLVAPPLTASAVQAPFLLPLHNYSIRHSQKNYTIIQKQQLFQGRHCFAYSSTF